ncbi:DUF6397 family protein [Streptomyces sp. NRRL S-340]|uniref:DUF6397 family protein n=1 Tax=Streptomyces sp. NRRL S-340 TaxID=1463901 RepID=UPI00056C419A|nr:DUF6397 family protein [Streptomyces sp. NRRL S-340]
MSGDTITHESTPAPRPAAGKRDTTTFSQSRAARELGLNRRQFDIAVRLGHIRTLPDEGGGGRRVAREEIERLRAQQDFPEALRKRAEAVVGTRQATEVMGVTRDRFTRLARLGLVVPVDFYVNRYLAVVWLYLADELEGFAADPNNAPLLNRPLPESLRDQLHAGLDLRPRNWRGRYLGFLLRQAGDPWERAAALASLLDPLQVAETVGDPCERAHLNRFRARPPAHGPHGSPTAHLTERITTAEDPDEIAWLRADLAGAVTEAREHRPAPRPALRHSDGGAAQDARPAPDGRREPTREDPSRGLLGRFFRRGA